MSQAIRVGVCACRQIAFSKAISRHGFIAHQQLRGHKRSARPTFKSLYNRRKEQGPEVDRHRSEWINWNYNAEMYAFGKRLGEDFNEEALRTAFTHMSFVEKERRARQDLDMAGDFQVDIQDSGELAHRGEELTRSLCQAFFRKSYPALPEEGIGAVSIWLMSTDVLSHVASNIGVKDLVLCEEFPPTPETVAQTFLAVVAALEVSQGTAQAQLLVRDFLLPQLVGKNIDEIWNIVNPVGLLQGLVARQGRGDVEPRLLYETGASTILSVYMVGFYSDQELLGKGYGETVTIAEEMAARDALQRFYGITHTSTPFDYKADLDLDLTARNHSIADYS